MRSAVLSALVIGSKIHYKLGPVCARPYLFIARHAPTTDIFYSPARRKVPASEAQIRHFVHYGCPQF